MALFDRFGKVGIKCPAAILKLHKESLCSIELIFVYEYVDAMKRLMVTNCLDTGVLVGVTFAAAVHFSAVDNESC